MAETVRRSHLENPAINSDQSIIQCPSCKTKFAVDSTEVAKLEFPRFHCSRCDHVFALDESTVSKGEAKEAKEGDSHFDELLDELSDEPSFVPDPPPARALEIPKKVELAPSSAPHEHINDQIQEPAAPGSQMAFPFSPGPKIERRPSARAETPKPAAQTKSNFDWDIFEDSNKKLTEKVRTESRPVSFDQAPDSSLFGGATHDLFENENDAHWAPQQKLRIKGLKRESWQISWTSAFLMPLLGFLLLLGALAAILSSTGELGTKISGVFFGNTVPLPPQGLYIKSSAFRKVDLENGETVNLISGKIVNESGATISDLMLEGFAFDKGGAPLTSLKVNASSTLAKTRVKSLSAEMIKTMQSSAARHFQMKPNSDYEFSFALFGDELQKARYYSVRVYSAN